MVSLKKILISAKYRPSEYVDESSIGEWFYLIVRIVLNVAVLIYLAMPLFTPRTVRKNLSFDTDLISVVKMTAMVALFYFINKNHLESATMAVMGAMFLVLLTSGFLTATFDHSKNEEDEDDELSEDELDSDDDEEEEDYWFEDKPIITDFGKYRKLQEIFQRLTLFWIGLSLATVLKFWQSTAQRNFWSGFFNGGLEWQPFGQVLLLTYFAFCFLQYFVYERMVCRSLNCLLETASLVSFLMANDQIWKLDRVKRVEMLSVYLLIYLSSFLKSTYDIIKIAYIQLQESRRANRAIQNDAAKIRVTIVVFSICLWICGCCYIQILSAHFLIFLSTVTYLLLTMCIDAHTNFKPYTYFVVNGQYLTFFEYLYTVLLKLLYLVIVVCTCIFQSVTNLRVVATAFILSFILKDTCKFYEIKIAPLICVWYLPRASAQQLAKNGNVCLMCHEEMDSACITPCNHFYHPNCLRRCLNILNKCPMCQYVLYENYVN